jgi:hypothetical protein
MSHPSVLPGIAVIAVPRAVLIFVSVSFETAVFVLTLIYGIKIPPNKKKQLLHCFFKLHLIT